MFDIADVLFDNFLPPGAWGLLSGTLRVVVDSLCLVHNAKCLVPGVWWFVPDAWRFVSGARCTLQ